MSAPVPVFPDGQSQQAALDAHVGAENAHDLDAIMATFAPEAICQVNSMRFDDPLSIRMLHEQGGFGGDGALSDLKVVESRRTFTADGIVVEGHLTGRHTGTFGAFTPTNRDVALTYCVIYQFGADGLLYSERAYIDLVPLSGD